MKRDMKIIKVILSAAEEAEGKEISFCSEISTMHLQMAIQAGLVVGKCTKIVDKPYVKCSVSDITWQGRDLLDKL
jgi:cell shape-determining protein MreC